MGYLTDNQAANLLKTISDAFAAEAAQHNFSTPEATQRWDALFKERAGALKIGYGVMDNPKGLSAMGTYIADITPFRAQRAAQIEGAADMYAAAQQAVADQAEAEQAAAAAEEAAKKAKSDAQAKKVKRAQAKQATVEKKDKAIKEGPRTLKKMQMHIKQYIKEIKQVQKEIKNSEDYTAISEDFWKAKIKELEAMSKKLANPESPESKKIITNVELVKDFQSVAYLDKILKKDLDAFVNDYEGVEDENENEKNEILNQLKDMKSHVASFFLLSRKHFKPPMQKELLPESKAPEAKNQDLNKGTAFLLSKIAGNPRKALLSANDILEKSIEKDIKKMLALYVKEINNINIKDSKIKKGVLNEVKEAQLTSDEIKKLTQSYDAKTLSNTISNKISLDNIMSEDEIPGFIEKISRKFAEASAPASHQSLIKEINKYIEKLEKELSKSPSQNLKDHLDTAKELHHNAIISDPIILQEKMREFRGFQEMSSDKDRKGTLYHLIEETIKISDPYYDDIKKLDNYIANLEKDIAKNPPKENEDFTKKSDRQAKLNIAKGVRASLIEPRVDTEKNAKYGDGKKVKVDSLTVDIMKNLIASNKHNTKTVIGRGKLDGILNNILKKLEPEQKKKWKP